MAAKKAQPRIFHATGDAPRLLSIGTPQQILDQGSTKPILFQLEDNGKPAGLWVMKPQCRLRRGGTDILRELAGAELCALVGLCTPAVGLVRIPDDPPPTDDSQLGLHVARVYSKDRGKLAFCSAYVEAPRADGGKLGPSGNALSRTVHDAILLVALDALVWHYDRTSGNPNALLYRRRLVPIDHDHAFFNIDAVDESGLTPDYAAPADHEHIANHIAADIAKQHLDSPAWEEVVQAVAKLTDQEIRNMVERWPDELDRSWAGDRVGWKDDFVRFVAARRDNVVKILEEARRAVGTG